MATPSTVKPGVKVTSPWLPDGGTVITQLFGVFETVLGINKPHEGIDIAAKHGSRVVLPQGQHATVQGAGWDAFGGGNFVKLKLDDGSIVELFHLMDVKVKSGQDISGGTLLGHVDSTGNSTGDHLHFQINRNGAAVDPWHWLMELGSGATQQDQGGSLNPLDAVKNVNDFFGHLVTPGHSPCDAPADEAALFKIIDAATCPRNWWRMLFIGIGAFMIGTGIFVYFFKEEKQVAVEVAPAVEAAAL